MLINKIEDIKKDLDKLDIPVSFNININTYFTLIKVFNKGFKDYYPTSIFGIKIVLNEDIPNGYALVYHGCDQVSVIKLYKYGEYKK